MKKFAGILGLAAGATMILSSAAFALDSSVEAMTKPGTHKFYVNCTGKQDFVDQAEGSDATDAQAKVAAKAGGTCWPVWQGLEG